MLIWGSPGLRLRQIQPDLPRFFVFPKYFRPVRRFNPAGLISFSYKYDGDLIMKQTVLMVLAGIACIVMIAVAGCTSSTGSAANVTSTATTEVTAAATTAAAAETTAQANVTAAAIAAAPNFAGDWNTTWKSGNDTPLVTAMTLVQDNATVAGTYMYDNVTGSVKGTVAGSVLSGSWKETAPETTYSGTLVLTLSTDGNSFTGKWASDSDAAGTINTTADYWNGVRV
jgi:preprotein translocase subunit Sec61beta